MSRTNVRLHNTYIDSPFNFDAYLVGEYEPVEEATGTVIAIIHRTNDDDDKLIIAPENKEYSDDAINALIEFQEQYFEHIIIR